MARRRGKRPYDILWSNAADIDNALAYIEAEDGPTFSSPQIIAVADTGDGKSIFTAQLGGKSQILIRGPWNTGVALNGVGGSRGAPLEIMNENSSTQAGLSSDASNHGLSAVNIVNFVHLSGQNKNNSFKFSAGAGRSGLVMLPIATVTNRGLVFRGVNLSGKDIGYAFLLFSVGILGYEYKLCVNVHLKKKGLIGAGGVQGGDGGEGGYWGHDDPSVQSRTRRLVCLHNAWMNLPREAEQWRYVDQLISYNRTGRNAGRSAISGQNHLSQVEDSNGFDLYPLEDGGPRLVNIITHGWTRQHFFSRYDGGAGGYGYIGKANDHFSGSPRLNVSWVAGVKKIVIRDGIIYADSPSPYAYLIDETDCDIDFINLIVTDNHSALYSDNRGAHSNVITVTNVVYVPKSTIPLPVYKSDDVDTADFCKVISIYHYALGLGAQTPVAGDQAVVDILEIVDKTVPFGTAFGTNGAGLSLPQTGSFRLSSRLFQTLSITWSVGAYDANTAGTYSVFGSPVVVAGVADPYGIQLECVVTVNGPPTVKINLGGTSGSYIGTGNWNHVFQSFSTGVQTIKGDSAGQTLASLRNTDGTLMGWGVSITSGFQGDVTGMIAAGLYPSSANHDEWTNPAGSGGRVFTITGLTPGHTYVFKLMSSVDSAIGGSHIVDVTVAGASGGGVFTGFDAKGNVNNLINGSGGISVVPTAGGVVTITVTKNTGVASLSVIEIVP